MTSTDSLVAEMMMAGRCDSFDESCVRGAVKMVPMGMRWSWDGSMELPDCSGPKPKVVANPFLARVDFSCPRCGRRAWITGRGTSGYEAREACVANVAAHGLTCAEEP